MVFKGFLRFFIELFRVSLCNLGFQWFPIGLNRFKFGLPGAIN